MAFDPDQIAETSLGRATLGIIRSNRIHLSWILWSQDVEKLDLVIFRAGGMEEYISLNPSSTDGAVVKSSLTFDPSEIVEAMLMIAHIKGEKYRLSHDKDHFYLDRLLARSLADVNKNLRWTGRINDLDTRFFAACNSIKLSPKEPQIIYRCVASFAYTAVEKDKTEMIEWAHNFCVQRMDEIAAESDAHVKASILNLWAHLAIWRGLGRDLLKISKITIRSLYDISEHPGAAYNAMSLMLLLGGFLLFTGRTTDAKILFRPFDAHLKAAASGHVKKGSPMTYREFIRISECAFLCSLGFHIAKGKSYPKSISPLTPEMAWNNSNRFYRGESKSYPTVDEGRVRYLKLIRKFKVDTV